VNNFKKYITIILFCLLESIFPQEFESSATIKSDSLLKIVDEQTDTQKINTLNKLSKEFELRDPDESLKFAKQAEELSKELGYQYGIAEAYMNIGNYQTEQSSYDDALGYYQLSLGLYRDLGNRKNERNLLNNIGNVYRYMGNYDKALEYFLTSMKMSEESNDKRGIAYATNNIGILYAIQKQYDKVLVYFNKTLQLSKEVGDKKGIAYSLNNIGLVYEELEEYEKAIKSHQESLEIKEEMGNRNGVSSSLKNIGNIYIHLNQRKKGLDYHLQALEIEIEIGNKFGIIGSFIDIGKINMESKVMGKALNYFSKALANAKEIKAKGLIKDSYEQLSILYERQNDPRKALDYYRLYSEAKDSLFNEKSSKQMAELQTRYETDKKEAEIKLLKNEKTISNLQLTQLESFRLYLSVVLLLIIILAIILYRAYRLKKKANLLLEEKNYLDMEDRARVLNMFGQQVSQEIVDELLTDSYDVKSKRKYVCIMFLDIRDFTHLVEDREPEDIISYQNDVFGFMIEIINKHFGIINQFLGDGYMATFGAPISTGHDCENAVKAALEIIQIVNMKTNNKEILPTKIGIGLHAGFVVTGNVGTSLRKQYSITGNTVILSSRIEKLNKKYNSQLLISEEVLNNIKSSNYESESLGEVVVKGREQPISIYKLA